MRLHSNENGIHFFELHSLAQTVASLFVITRILGVLASLLQPTPLEAVNVALQLSISPALQGNDNWAKLLWKRG
jgi:hypothetical protein